MSFVCTSLEGDSLPADWVLATVAVMSKPGSLQVVLFGGSGFLGGGLKDRLVGLGHSVTVIGRGPATEHPGWRSVQWDARSLGPWVDDLDGVDVIVHLAGKRVDCRPTSPNIDELIESREGTVRLVGQALDGRSDRPSVWVQLSSLARFGDAGDEIIDETTTPPNDGPRQQVEVCRRWEQAFDEASGGIERRVLVRPAISIGGAGDPATAQLTRLARFGLGGRVGSGRQWVSWIAADDMFEILTRAVVDPTMSGLYHATSPNPVQNAELMAAYRSAVGRRFGLRSPAWIATVGAWILGSDPALALTGRRCVPTRLLEQGFEFTGTTIDDVVAQAASDNSTRPRA